MNKQDTFVTLTEVGPRDGLQNEARQLSLDEKASWIKALAETGVNEIEAGAFVSPKAIPQMADSELLYSKIKSIEPKTRLSFLVPNQKGFDAALRAKVKRVAFFTAASESFNQKNINKSIASALKEYLDLGQKALKENLSVRVYVSCAFVCPYEGGIDPKKVIEVMKPFADKGFTDFSLGDTIGKATPEHVARLLNEIGRVFWPKEFNLAMHFHDTYSMALANVYESLKFGVRHFDSAAGGLGGCPYAKGASGNLATEDLMYFLKALGYQPAGLKPWAIHKVVESTQNILKSLNRISYSKVHQAINLSLAKDPS